MCFSGRFRPHLELLVLMDMSEFRLFANFALSAEMTFLSDSLNNGYVEGSFIRFLELVRASPDPKSVAHNLVAPRIL